MAPSLRTELLAMARADEALRAELVARGELFAGYHPRMQQLHAAHAGRLAAILDEHGWPSRRQVGEDGQAAAWLVLQHAIEHPSLMRTGLRLLEQPPASTEVDPAKVAMLDDRIRVLEGRAQRFGTQHDWNDAGQLAPQPIEDPDGVDERRRSVGLPPLHEQTEQLRARAAAEGDGPPPSLALRRAEQAQWARRVGWRD